MHCRLPHEEDLTAHLWIDWLCSGVSYAYTAVTDHDTQRYKWTYGTGSESYAYLSCGAKIRQDGSRRPGGQITLSDSGLFGSVRDRLIDS